MTDVNFPTENQDNVVVLAAARPAKVQNKVCNANLPPINTATNAIIEQGKAALVQLERDRQTWPLWVAASQAQLAIQTLAMAAAQTNTPQGPRYREAVRNFLALHGFDRINKGTRSIMCEVARKLAAIEQWRSALPPEELLELNHPRVVLDRWKRSIRATSGQDSKAPPPEGKPNPMLEGWNKATLEQRTTGLTQIRFDDFRQVMPGDWSKPMKECVGRLRPEDRDPDSRITRVVQKALEHLEIADDPKTSKPVGQGHEKEALGELREALRALHAIKRHVHDLDVGFTNPKAKRRSTS
jgi:hypothetical protein